MANLVIALDYPDKAGAMAMAKTLKGADVWVKVGLELFTAAGPEIIGELRQMGLKVFLDMKFFDIPNTVQGAVRSSVRHGVDMVNIHLMGGERMARAAVAGLAEGSVGSGVSPILLGVTVLTSMSQEDLPKGMTTSLEDTVLSFATSGKEWGIHGVVCSGFEVDTIKKSCGNDFLCLTPGIRPVSLGDDQRRTMTPAQAVKAGSDYLVVGRPVTGADSPLHAAQEILEAMKI